MNLLKRFIGFLTKGSYPKNLLINDRSKLPTKEFDELDKLYRSYDKNELDDEAEISFASIRFPDISSNWSRFSNPKDVLRRMNADPSSGCYSITVLTSRYKKYATPVHDPFDDEKFPNYSHVEIRVLKSGEDILFEPPKNRRIRSHPKKNEYRFNILKNLHIEFEAT